MAILGAYLLKKIGRLPGGEREDTSVLVTLCAYRYIRHPLYCSLYIKRSRMFIPWLI